MLTTDRAVLIRYLRGGTRRRGSGLHAGGRYVLTAGHCAAGTGHTIVVGGAEYAATVMACSDTADIDIAVLECPALPPAGPLPCAAVAWEVPRWVRGCRALGFPLWKDGIGGPLLAQVPVDIPAAEGVDPGAGPGTVPLMSVKITSPAIREHRVPAGELDQVGSPWAGMSGAVVVTADDRLIGVIRGHSPAEGTGSLTATRLSAIASLPDGIAEKLLTALAVPHPRRWPRLPTPDADGTTTAAAGRVVVGEIPREPPAFVARETIGRLAEAAGRGTVALVCAVTGLRGVGKTQVAAAYARARASEGWELVGWVNAETRDTLLAGLARIAERLGVADPEGDSLESARRLREHLQADTGRALLVFDNATDPDDLRPLLPATGIVQVVITSTDQAFADFGEPVDVAVYTRPESLSYLHERTRLDDDPGADSVARELGDLPLALAQAAATIRRQHLSYPAYLERLRQVPVRELLGRTPGSDYPHATAAALLLSVQGAEAADPAGLTSLVLRVLAALSPDGVRRDFLDGLAAAGANGPPMDVVLERCVAGSLLNWSVSGSAVVMHRLLGRVLRERDRAAGQWASTVAAALDLLGERTFPREEAWARREEGTQLIAQLEALWEADTGTGGSGTDLRLRQVSARCWAVRQLRLTADLSRAIDLGSRALADCEGLIGADHPQALLLHNELALAYRSAGQLDQAIALFKRAVAGRERVLGADHPDTLTSRSNLAGAYRAAGRLSEAIALYEQTLPIRERVLGPDDPKTLSSRNDLAYAYRTAGRLDLAIPLYEQALADRERVLGPEHPETLASRSNLGFAYRSAGRLAKAIPMYEQTLADRERTRGPDHPEALVSRNNLAFAYRAAGRFGEAIALYKRTLADRERILGPDHPQTLLSRNNLGYALGSAGRLREAIAMLEQTLADRERVLGRDHPQTFTSRADLAVFYRDAGRLEEAIALTERTLADRERVLGHEHPQTLIAQNNLARMYALDGRVSEGITLFERTLADRARLLGTDHPQTLISRNDLAGAYVLADRLEEGIALFERALADRKRVLGADHPQTLISQNGLAGAYLAAGRVDEAIALFEGTLADQERLLSADHLDTLTSRTDLAGAYEAAGQLPEAVALFERALSDSERVLGDDHPQTVTTRQNLERARAGVR